MRKPPIGLVLVVALGTWGVRADAVAPGTWDVRADADPKKVDSSQADIWKTIGWTTIEGEITVPNDFSSGKYGNGPVALGQGGFGCGNLVIIADSKAMKPVVRPPTWEGIWLDQPVWSKSVQATGTWSSGKCNYVLHVPWGQEFSLTAGTTGNFNCDYVDVFVTNTPAWQSVAKGTTTTDNITVSYVACVIIG